MPSRLRDGERQHSAQARFTVYCLRTRFDRQSPEAMRLGRTHEVDR